jgi:tetratricopeptide (TPR) repeat protein
MVRASFNVTLPLVSALIVARRARLIVFALLSAMQLAAPPARAQQRSPEFTRQGLLVIPFTSRERKVGRKVASELTKRIAKLSPKEELEVVPARDMDHELQFAGYDPDAVLPVQVLTQLARRVRADEYVIGTVERAGGAYRLSARLVLMRNERVQQPLPVVTAMKLEDAAAELATHVRDARRQAVPVRRCENAIRAGRYEDAIAAATEAVASHPAAALGRTCLLLALERGGPGPEEVLRVARELLAIDSSSFYGIEGLALAYDAMDRRAEAADAWRRVMASDPNDVELAARAIRALTDDGNATVAQPLILRLSDDYPDRLDLWRLRWHVLVLTNAWNLATQAGETLLVRDSLAASDSSFLLRLAGAYRESARPIRALELAARGTTTFPNDPRLYLLYAQLVRAESETAIARGIERHPASAELRVLLAQDLKSKGRSDEALAASRRAVELDPSMSKAYLQLAQVQLDLGRDDSVYVTLHRALGAHEDSAAIGQFALARGNAIFRAANASKNRDQFELAMRFLALADSIRPSTQSKFLLGAAALSATQIAAAEAPRTRSCQLSQEALELLPLAQANLTAGAETAPDAARQYLAYLEQLQPVVRQQAEVLCKS